MTVVNNDFEELYVKYTLAMRKLEAEINNLIESYEFSNEEEIINHTMSRVKKFESAIKKMEKRGIAPTPENMETFLCDMVGVRVVTPFMSNVYDVVDLIKSSSSIDIIEEKDYIKEPKESGYKSYHLDVLVPIEFNKEPINVKAEIQVRSMAMDLWATLDHKLRYKLSDTIQTELCTEFLARAKDVERFDARMQSLKEEVQDMKDSEEIEKPKRLIKR